MWSDAGCTRSEGGLVDGLGFNLCVASFSNAYIPNFKLESVWSKWLELVGGWLGWLKVEQSKSGKVKVLDRK